VFPVVIGGQNITVLCGPGRLTFDSFLAEGTQVITALRLDDGLRPGQRGQGLGAVTRQEQPGEVVPEAAALGCMGEQIIEARGVLLERAGRGRDTAAFADGGAPSAEAQEAGTSEGYELAVTARRVAIWGESPAGLARGAQTLRQLLRGDAGHAEGWCLLGLVHHRRGQPPPPRLR